MVELWSRRLDVWLEGDHGCAAFHLFVFLVFFLPAFMDREIKATFSKRRLS